MRAEQSAGFDGPREGHDVLAGEGGGEDEGVTPNPRPSATHAARCTARHAVAPTPAGANIGLAMKYARHSPSAMWLSEPEPRRSTPTTTRPSPVHESSHRWSTPPGHHLVVGD
jgi:hypothetical protein